MTLSFLQIILMLHLVVFVLNSSLALFVWLRSSKKLIKVLYSSFSLSLALWNLSLFFTVLNVWPQIIWSRLAFSFGVVMAAALFYFSFSFPTGKRMKKRYEIPFLFFSAIVFFFTTTPQMVSSVDVSSGYIDGQLGPAMGLFTIYVLLFFFLTLFIVTLRFFSSKGLVRRQLFYIMTGQWFFIVMFLTTNLVLPVFFGVFKYNLLGPVFSFLMVGLIAYSIVRHKLFDIRFVLQRGLIYSFSFAVIIIFYLLLIFLFDFFLEAYIEVKSIIATVITILLGVYGLPYLEKFFQKATDKIFYKDRYDFSLALKELGEVLNKNIGLEELLRSFAKKLTGILKLKKMAILLLGEKLILEEPGEFRKIDKNFDLDALKKSSALNLSTASVTEIKEFAGRSIYKNNISYLTDYANRRQFYFVVKIFANKKLIGYIFLGDKKSGDIFNEEDRRLLENISLQAGVAIEKARLYKKVQDYSKNLEKKVKKRTAKIEGLQKEQKQLMLEIAHRLQTPLTIMKGDLEQIKKEHKKIKKFERFEFSLNKLSKFIYDILKLARLENKSAEIEMEKMNLSKIVSDLGEYFQVVMWEKDINFSVSVDRGVFVLGNEDKIEELISNLVSNSEKYIGKGAEKTIKLNLKTSGSSALLSVEDNGIGISKQDREKIFSSFYRSENTSQYGVEGTGLGLVIVKKIAEIHGADVELDSELGRGTKIKIRFKAV